MKMQDVESSMIKAVGYDEEKAELHVKFNNDSVYKYTDVNPPLFQKLLAAESKGKFLNAKIKKVFNFEKVE